MKFISILLLLCTSLFSQSMIQTYYTNPSGNTTLIAGTNVATMGVYGYFNDYIDIYFYRANAWAACGYIMSHNTYYGIGSPAYLSVVNPGIITPLDQVGFYTPTYEPYLVKLYNVLNPSMIGNIFYIQVFEIMPPGGFPISISDQFVYIT